MGVLLDAGGDKDAAGDGVTPLHRASAMGHVRAVQVLLKAGASLSTVAKIGMTPATFAARSGHVEVLQAMRDLGGRTLLDLSSADKSGSKFTPLHYAAQNGHLDGM